MVAKVKVRTRGGEALKRWIAQAKAARATSTKGVRVGFFEDARYSAVHQGKNGGRPREPRFVAEVAAWNEWGHRGNRFFGPTPERPFFRQSIPRIRRTTFAILRKELDPRTMAVTPTLAGRIGAAAQGEVQLSITELRSPPNSPTTQQLKGSSNPLVDTGFLRASTSYRIIR